MLEPKSVVRSATARIRSVVLRSLLFVAIVGVVFAIMEGLSSTFLFVAEVARTEYENRYYAADPERRHVEYDRDLGWISIPNLSIPDMYGPGRDLRTNACAFRNDRETETEVPQGRIRAICSGDSFTFGQGVANDRTWCHLLSGRNERLETVNMGQRGYGVDQAYLWYARDGAALEHDIHVFAFIEGDFARMQTNTHHGYGKPILRLDGERLVVDNVPVPRFHVWRPWMSRTGRAATKLRSVELIGKVIRRTSPMDRNGKSRTDEIALEVFKELRRINEGKESVLILLWLPVEPEIEGDSPRWGPWVRGAAKQIGVPLIDLGPELRQLVPAEAESLFIPKEAAEYVDAAGHYNEKGHAWVADVLYRRMLELPQVRAILAEGP